MSAVLKTLAALAVLGVVAAAAVVGLGLYNVSARAGHLPGVAWVLHTTYENAVRLRAPSRSEVPDLTDPGLVALGALHFDRACRMCHAAPGEVRPATVRAMNPVPPHVTDAVEGWEARHLHWIVYEGVKMSGMPGWPAPRPGEVWPVVAFLTEVAEMTPETYAELTAPPEAADDAAFAYCAGCHGTDGIGRLAPHVPRLDILDEDYLTMSLAAFREGARQSGIMQHAATEVAPEVLDRLATRFAELPAGSVAGASQEPDLVRVGAALARAEPADDDVPACRACHGPGATRSATATPTLAGQHAAYLETQLHLWRDGLRGGGPRANLMHGVAHDLTDADIEALAAYYASLEPKE